MTRRFTRKTNLSYILCINSSINMKFSLGSLPIIGLPSINEERVHLCSPRRQHPELTQLPPFPSRLHHLQLTIQTANKKVDEYQIHLWRTTSTKGKRTKLQFLVSPVSFIHQCDQHFFQDDKICLDSGNIDPLRILRFRGKTSSMVMANNHEYDENRHTALPFCKKGDRLRALNLRGLIFLSNNIYYV